MIYFDVIKYNYFDVFILIYYIAIYNIKCESQIDLIRICAQVVSNFFLGGKREI